MYSNIVRDVQGVALGELSFEEGAASLKESLGNIETDWTDYLGSHVVPEAEPIVAVAKQRMEEAKPNIDELGRLLDGQDLAALNLYVKQTLGDTMESIASQFDQLAEIQIGVAQTDDEGAKALSASASIGLAAVAAISAGILAYALFVVMIGVMRPLNGMEKSMRTLAGGETSTTIPYLTRRDEIGRMAAAVEVFRQNAEQVRTLTDAEAARLVRTQGERAAMMQTMQCEFRNVVDAAIAGDFSRRVTASFADRELTALAQSVNTLVGTVESGLSETGAVLTALAKMDLSKRFNGSFQGAFAQLKADTMRWPTSSPTSCGS